MRMHCSAYRIRTPDVNIVSKDYWPFQTMGFFRTYISRRVKRNLEQVMHTSINDHPTIFICLDRCSSANQLLNFPGGIIDTTPVGILCHQLGHYLDCIRSNPSEKKSYYGNRAEELLHHKELPLTRYEIDKPYEVLAETYRLFVSNPDLLRELRPKTFENLCLEFTDHATYQVYRHRDRPWKKALRGCSTRIKSFTLNKVQHERDQREAGRNLVQRNYVPRKADFSGNERPVQEDTQGLQD